jgi:hypothetical protein
MKKLVVFLLFSIISYSAFRVIDVGIKTHNKELIVLGITILVMQLSLLIIFSTLKRNYGKNSEAR